MSKSRQFKFRVWDKVRKKFSNDIRFVSICLGDKSAGICVSKDSLILSQFTGLKDQNGVEIYEGDVLYYNDDSDDVSGLVKWENFGFIIDWQISGYRKNLNAWAKNNENEFKIIGNIYENPELLKN